MKIHFGFPNLGGENKLSPSLQALGVNLLKAEPSKIALKGLHRIPQDGYAEYSAHFPAFMYATELQKSVPLSREGYPVLTKAENVIPLSMPPVYITFKGNKDVSPAIKNITDVKTMSVKDKNIKAYTLEYKVGLLGHIRSSEYEPSAFPIANTVSADDLSTLITIIRIFSSFFRTHKYAAFDTGEDYELEFASLIESKKRPLTNDDDYATADDGAPLKRMALLTEDGEPTWAKPERVMSGNEVTLRRAKPSDDSIEPWGDASLIPTTDGIVFPFVEELAVWDKDSVCNTIGRYFVRCLGHTTEGCLKAYSDLCLHWKRSLYRSSIGNCLSHLAKVIDIAIPAQARVFPVIQETNYTGCYLSGAGYSVALRGDLLRPTSYDNNSEDFDCFDSTDALLMKILALVTNDTKEKKNIDAIRKTASGSMRGLDVYLTRWILSTDKLEKIRTLASRIRYPQEFLRINMENIQLALSMLQAGKDPPIECPMHAHGLGRRSRIESILSAFGPSAPSPNIPGSQKISVSSKIPAGFNKVLAFRTTSLETAISDWKEFGDKGFVYNGPERLSGRYQYVQVRGEEDRGKWFLSLHGFYTWYKAEQKSALKGEVENIEYDDNDGVPLGSESVDFTGF